MTRSQWLAEVQRRIGINEGCRSTMYHDTMGIPTVGIGFNLDRDDATKALLTCGVTDVNGVKSGNVSLTATQIAFLFQYSFGPIESEARDSLAVGVYDALSDARRFVICDLVFNLGAGGWGDFANTRALINQAQQAKDAGNATAAHALFEAAADHLANSAWFVQVGDRARRDVAMLRNGTWVDAFGNGTY